MRTLLQHLNRIEIHAYQQEEQHILPDPQGKPTRFTVTYHVTARLLSWPKHEVVTGRFATRRQAQAWIDMLTPSVLACFRPSSDHRSPQDTSQWSWWLSLASLERADASTAHAIIPSVWGVKLPWGLDENWGIMLDTPPCSSADRPRIMLWGPSCVRLLSMCDFAVRVHDIDYRYSMPIISDNVQEDHPLRDWLHTLRAMIDTATRPTRAVPSTVPNGFVVIVNDQSYSFRDDCCSILTIARSDGWQIKIKERGDRSYSYIPLPDGPWKRTASPHRPLPYCAEVSMGPAGRPRVYAFVSSFNDAMTIAFWLPSDIAAIFPTHLDTSVRSNRAQRWHAVIQRFLSASDPLASLQGYSQPVLIAYQGQWYVMTTATITKPTDPSTTHAQPCILFQGSSLLDVITAIRREPTFQHADVCVTD